MAAHAGAAMLVDSICALVCFYASTMCAFTYFVGVYVVRWFALVVKSCVVLFCDQRSLGLGNLVGVYRCPQLALFGWLLLLLLTKVVRQHVPCVDDTLTYGPIRRSKRPRGD